MKHNIGKISDLVVVHDSANHPIRDFFLGSRAERLLAETNGPVLVVRNEAPRTPYKRVLVALDFSEFDDAVIASARAAAPQARIDLMHVFETRFEGKMRYAGVPTDAIEDYRAISRESAMKTMRVAAERVPEHASAIVVPGPVASNVVRQAQDMHADLIVVGHPKRSWLSNLLVPRIAARVLATAKSDVLVVQ